MTYSVTSFLGLSLAVPGSGQAFETSVMNGNFQKILDKLQDVANTSAAGVTAGLTQYAGSVTEADPSIQPSLISRTGRIVAAQLNLLAPDGVVTNGALCVLPSGFRPQGYASGRLAVVNGSVYQNVTVDVEVNSVGTVQVKTGSVGAGLKVAGTISFVAA